MRWKLNDEPETGDQRIVEKFLFLPTRIGNEVR
jgi:hypothetical protein